MTATTTTPTPREVLVARAELVARHAAIVAALADFLAEAQQVEVDTATALADCARRARTGQDFDDGVTFTGLSGSFDQESWAVDVDGQRLTATGRLALRLVHGAVAGALVAARVHTSTVPPAGWLTSERIAGWARP